MQAQVILTGSLLDIKDFLPHLRTYKLITPHKQGKLLLYPAVELARADITQAWKKLKAAKLTAKQDKLYRSGCVVTGLQYKSIVVTVVPTKNKDML
jgi:hypothetical protein